MNQEKSFIDIVNKRLSMKNNTLPVFDKTALRIQKELMQPEPDIRAIEHLISSDQSLTSQILRMANSAFYKGLVKVTTVHNAIVRIGIGEVSNMVMIAAHQKQFRSKSPFFRVLMDKLWRHAVGCAIGSNWLAKHCGYKTQASEAFLAGLLHDVGKLFLLTVIESIQEADKKIGQFVTLIDEVLESLHAEHGYALLKNWNLPDIYSHIARDHHSEEIDENNSLMLMVRLADKACNMMGIGLIKDDSLILAASEEADLLSVSEISLAELEIKLEDSLVLTR